MEASVSKFRCVHLISVLPLSCLMHELSHVAVETVCNFTGWSCIFLFSFFAKKYSLNLKRTYKYKNRICLFFGIVKEQKYICECAFSYNKKITGCHKLLWYFWPLLLFFFPHMSFFNMQRVTRGSLSPGSDTYLKVINYYYYYTRRHLYSKQWIKIDIQD